MNIEKLQHIPNGSNLLVRRPGLLPAGIRHFMMDEYNHTEKIVYKNGIIQTFGAIKPGSVYRPLEKAIEEEDWLKIEVWAPVFDFNNDKLIHICDKYEGTPYQKVNFIQWLIWLKWGIWFGKSSNKRMYCYETTARVSEDLYPGTFPKDHFIERTHIKMFRQLSEYCYYGTFVFPKK